MCSQSLSSSTSGTHSTGSSNLGRDAALGAGAIGAGTAAHHHGDHDSGRSFPLGGSSGTTAGSNYASGQTGTYPAGGSAIGSSTAGPHASNLDGSRTAGTTGLGSSTSGFGSGTGPSASSNNQGSLGRDTGMGAGGVGAATSTGAGSGPDNWQHQHGTHGHQYAGDPCGPGAAATGAPHFTSGPHVTDTANRLDPRVASGTGSSSATTGTSTGSGLASSSTGHHGARDAGLATGAGAAGAGGYEASRHNADSTATGPAPNTAGPHKSDILNKMDPRVDSDLSKQQGTSGAGLGSASAGTGLGSSNTTGSTTTGGLGSSTTGSSNTGGLGSSSTGTGLGSSTTGTGLGSSTTGSSDPYSSTATGRDHIGRNAGLAAGAGLGGAGAYEAEKHHRSHDPPTGSTLGQTSHSSAVPGTTGSNTLGGTRDTTGSGYDPQAGTGHHYGRDAGLVGAGGVGAYEADKHLGSYDRSAPQDRLAGSGHQPMTTTTTTTTMTPQDRLAGHDRQSNVASHAPLGTETARDHSHQTGHHGRDAAVAGGVGAGAGGAAYETERMRTHGYADPGTNVREHQGAGHPSVATYPSPGYGNESAIGTGQQGTHTGHQGTHTGHQGTHTGRDTALAGGAGAGAGAVAGHEYSKKEAEKLQKEHAKEEKALEKEHHKEQKHHDKELAKEEKHHEKAIAAEQKKHDKHHDDHGRDEKHDGEKKHGGLMGLLHRDKPDPELREEEAQRKAGTAGIHHGRGEEEMAGGAGAVGLGHRTAGTGGTGFEHRTGGTGTGTGFEHGTAGTGLDGRQGHNALAGEHGTQSGVHDTSIGTGPTTHDAYGTTEGHNRLHKDSSCQIRRELRSSAGSSAVSGSDGLHLYP